MRIFKIPWVNHYFVFACENVYYHYLGVKEATYKVSFASKIAIFQDNVCTNLKADLKSN